MNPQDVLSRLRFRPAELRDLEIEGSPLGHLALMFFVARHAAPSAQVVVLSPRP